MNVTSNNFSSLYDNMQITTLEAMWQCRKQIKIDRVGMGTDRIALEEKV